MPLLVINAGSSSIKFSVFSEADGTPRLELHGQLDGLHATPHLVAHDAGGVVVADRSWQPGEAPGYAEATRIVLALVDERLGGGAIEAVGHRVVHGGESFSAPTRVTDDVLAALEHFVPLAPLHQPHNLAPIRSLLASHPELPQVACFDTAFHRTQPQLAQLFALPQEITARGVRRYGFHGLSYEYIASVLPRIDPAAAAGRTIVAHLGNGASLCALQGGRSVATTMGFTALDGLPMGTRSGSVDPGVLLYLMDELHMDARAIEKLLYQRSGLLGVSGISSDMRVLAQSDAPAARLAIDLFVYRIGRELGSLAAALGGLDALVFTAGIGEHQPAIRSRICATAAWLGVEVDERANVSGGARISTASSRVSVWIIPTDEEAMIARHTREVLESRRQG
jgi:acetate kinase